MGETKLAVSIKVNENFKNVLHGEVKKLKLAEHSWYYNHRFKFNEFSLLCSEPHSIQRKLEESINIKLNKVVSHPSINIPEVCHSSILHGPGLSKSAIADVNYHTTS